MSRTEAERPDSPRLAEDAAAFRSVYVHVPFCARVCPYCDFAVVEGRDDLADRYLSALLTEIGNTDTWGPVDALFVGGGTPSRFGADRLSSIVVALDDRFGLAPDAEITLEANPEDWTAELAHGLVVGGFNRVSFGAQSFDRSVLRILGRRHVPGEIDDAVTTARVEGFASVSVDLIFGTVGEDLARWQTSVERAIALDPDHVSCYALTVERGTPLGRQVAAGSPGPDADLQADQYEAAADLLAGHGLIRYEVSNWARSGHVCKYNLSVWGQGEYEAFGNGAHGFRGGARFRNVRQLDAYLYRVESGMSPRAGVDPLVGFEAEQDRLFVGLRRVAGVSGGPGVDALLGSEMGRRLQDAGLIEWADGRLRVLDPLLTDEVERAVLSMSPESR